MKNFEKFSEKQMLSSEAREVKGGDGVPWLICAGAFGLCEQELWAQRSVLCLGYIPGTGLWEDCMDSICAGVILECTIF